MSIRFRLTLWYSGILATTLLIFGLILYWFFKISFMNSVDEQLKNKALEVQKGIQYNYVISSNHTSLVIRLDEYDSIQDNIYLQITNLTNKQINRSSSLQMKGLQIPVNADSMKEGFETVSVTSIYTDQQFKFRIYTIPLNLNNQLVGVLQAGTPIGGIGPFLTSLKLTLITTVLMTIIIAASFGWFLARTALKPIENVIIAANQIENGTDLEKRILYDGPQDEIGRLVSTINGMLSRIQTAYVEMENAYRAQRRFVSDASHELRTPLTTIRGNVDLLEKVWNKAALPEGSGRIDGELMNISTEAMMDIASEAERMSRLVNDMLSLARADTGYTMQKDFVDMKPLVETVVRRAHFLPRTAEWIAGDFNMLNDTYVYGNKDYLQQLLFIFIENGFKYTKKGYVKLEITKKDEQIGFIISDTGIGIDKEEVPNIFQRFYRVDVSRGETSGTGLGLSIAKWIIDQHNGSVEVKTIKGEGTTFIIWLPMSFPGMDD